MPWRRQTSPCIDRHRQVLAGIARDCQILPGIMTVQILENEHRCRIYLKNVVCFEMTSNERGVHFSKFRNKTFKTNMDIVFIWKTWCVFKWHRTKVVCTFANFASFSQNEHGCRMYLKNMVCFQMTSDESFCQHFQNEHDPKQGACSAGWFEKEGVVPWGCHMIWSSRYVRSWFTESFRTGGQESEQPSKMRSFSIGAGDRYPTQWHHPFRLPHETPSPLMRFVWRTGLDGQDPANENSLVTR